MVYPLVALLCGLAAFFSLRVLSAARRRRRLHDAVGEAFTIVRQARDAAAEVLTEAEREAAQAAARRRQQMDTELSQWRDMLHKGGERTGRRTEALQRNEERLRSRTEALAAREEALGKQAERKRQAETGRQAAEREAKETLVRLAEETPREARDRMVSEWVEQVRAEAMDLLRQIDQNSSDPEYVRLGRRMLEIASQRYQGHYLTERLLSNIPIVPGTAQRLAGADLVNLQIIGEVANVKLTLSDDEQSIRLEGQDSFGREIARRAIARFIRTPPRGEEAVRRAVKGIAEELDRETFELGKRAFKELEIPRSHPEIVRLVGRLNYRTSYTQNQWKHAIESAFLCGMMAAELRLDVKLARRAALMHDIGKAMTHEIDGSHAVIGADYARRLGETELVANAIGAHHTDEPFNSPYALIVAAADAMSGGRPGARHEQADSYVSRIEDLEKLAGSFPGISHVYAVQAGREVRVHVKENQVDDLRAAEMSTEIAHRISEQMVFPGQIKVTVIREVSATAVAS